MNIIQIIDKKSKGKVLSRKEIEYFINGYTNGIIPDYQVSSLLMAIKLKGMNRNETVNLTRAMLHSGDVNDLSSLPGVTVDKHSTGGVGDKTTIVLAPLVAACGLTVAKMSGRGLGHTGGTIDKLESFEGFRTDISTEKFIENVNTIGVSIMGQTANLAPADKKLYALRDVTATVDNMSLIASSIMSKKLAAGSDAIVLDVKTGSGAFMKKKEDAFALAKAMVNIGNMAGRKTIAVITDMDQPLGYAIGNALEVKEAIDTLKGKGPDDFTKLCYTLGAMMLVAGEIAADTEEATKLIKEAVESGKAYDKFVEFIGAQGGNVEQVNNPELLPKATIELPVLAGEDGYVERIICDEVGICSLILGGGRENKETEIDLSVGIILHKKVGDYVSKDTKIATLYGNSEEKLETAKERLLKAYLFSEREPEKRDLIQGIIE